MNHRLTALVALLCASLLVLAGCGGKEDRLSPGGDPDELTVMLDFFPNADHVGIYAAQQRGYFRRAGLAVDVRTPSDPAAPLKLLAAGRVDLAISYEPEVLLARDKGTSLVAVGAIVQRPLTSLISLPKSGVREPSDLRGKTVGTAGIPYQSAYLQTILERAGVDPGTVREVTVGFNFGAALVPKKVDATFGGFWNYEGVQLRQNGKDPIITRADEAGVPTYNELVVVARAEDLANNGGRVRRFMQALGRGYALARRDPSAGVDALLAGAPDLRDDRRLQAASVEATLPYFFPADDRRPFGFQDPREWRRFGRWMLDNELIENEPLAQEALTNEFLAGQGS